VVLPSLGAQKLDMYFKVVQKNNEEKNNSTLYLLVSTGNENFASPTGDTALWNSSKMFLNSFIEKTTAYNLEQNIKAQENTVKDSQKKLASLQKDEKDLAEKIKKYQNDLSNNQNNQKDQQEDIENQQKLLESLILTRKG
jgi:septal ring factor EnvC (AmiA/AmiB activator)